MRTPPSHLPPVPEGFEYWGKGPLKVASESWSEDVARSFPGRLPAEIHWATGYKGEEPTFHYALRIGSDIHRANFETPSPKLTFTAGVDFGSRADQPTVSVFAYEELQAERDRWAEATSEQLTQVKRLTAENESLKANTERLKSDAERLKAQVKLRDSIIQGIKVALNNVMDF